jgi:hypothetical protein
LTLRATIFASSSPASLAGTSSSLPGGFGAATRGFFFLRFFLFFFLLSRCWFSGSSSSVPREPSLASIPRNFATAPSIASGEAVT